MSDKLPCCGNDKIILVDISDHFERKIECSECGTQFYQNKTTGELTRIGKIGKKKKAPDMSDKRPWTPGPWDNVLSQITIVNKHSEANWKLCLKSPEFAELLIELAELDGIQDEAGVYWPLCKKARQLLKEIGYNV